MIGKVVQRIPTESRKGIAGGLMFVIAIGAPFALLMFMGFSESTEEKCKGHLWKKECTDAAIPLSERIPYLLIAIGILAVVVLAAVFALFLTMSQSHLKKYQAILTGVETMSVQRIADITHARPSRVRAEIQSLIDSDEIDDFYIDYGTDQVVSKKYIPKTSHKTVVKCSECGGNNEVIVGITRHCSFLWAAAAARNDLSSRVRVKVGTTWD